MKSFDSSFIFSGCHSTNRMATGVTERETLKCSIEVYTYYVTIRDIHEHPQCAAYDPSSSNSNPVLSSECSCLNIEPILPTQSADF